MEKEFLKKEFENADISTLIALRDSIQKTIDKKREKDFKDRVSKICSMIQELVRDYPYAVAILETSIEEEEDIELDVLRNFNKLHWDSQE